MTTNLQATSISKMKSCDGCLCVVIDFANLLVKNRNAAEGAAQPFRVVFLEFGVD